MAEQRILLDAEPFSFEGNSIGCLVVHGFTSTPQSVRYWGEYLARAGGLTIVAPRLTGHGTTPADMARSTAEDWIRSVEGALEILRRRCDKIFCAGLGMGGTLSLYLAAVHPETITGVVAINGVVFLNHPNKKTGATAANYGLTWAGKLEWDKIGKSLLLAIIIVASGHLLLSLADWWLKVDFRLWVLALKPMSFLHFQIFLAYLIPFAFFFLVLSTALHGQLRVNGSVGREMLINAIMLSIGFVLLLLFQYIPFFGGGTLALAALGIAGGEPLLTIVAIQIVPLMVIVACVSTFFYHKTGKIYVGAFINALFITWYIVAGQAIHFAL